MAKKNIYKVPQNILRKIEAIKSNEIVVGCAIKFKAQDLLSGRLKHLGISLTSEELNIPKSVIPPKDQGRYSKRNINGVVIIRKDLPLETHYNSVDTPNWGDSYYGTHTVDLPYHKYPRDFRAPRELEILITCKDTRPGLPEYIITFQVQEILDKNDVDFNKRLFENLNLLQENIGSFGVEAASIPLSEYSKSLYVSWEILPPGTLEETIERVFRGKIPTKQQKDVTTERYVFFQSLKPKNLVFGQSGFRRYFGALLEDNLVVFENIEYGNAIYILFENWEELSKLSRTELLSGRFGISFDRIIHISGWKEKVKTIVTEKRESHQSSRI
ncbi:MAG: hypothetical protein KBB71_04865 [Lentimicrobiaceae bacterium]|nr:hypothetical protein [Lentimicrobiaceae bacterium]